MRTFLIYFSGVEVDFRRPEFESLCGLLNLELSVESGDLQKERYYIVKTEEPEKLRALANRSVLIHKVTELWGQGSTIDELRSSSRRSLSETKFDIPTESWKFNFEVSNKRGLPIAKQLEYSEELDITFDGPVSLTSPQHVIDLYLDFGQANKPPDRPVYYYFGRRFCDSGRELVVKYDTRDRAFLGNTAMCAQMALLMANQAKVMDGSLVLDPFVGSGGITVACAEFGGYCLGSDINMTLLRGRGLSSRGHGYRKTTENFRSCFEQYGVLSHFVDVIGSDQHRPAWRNTMVVDAIVTDPPYGVRESPRKQGADQGTTTRYDTTDLVQDLLQFSLKHLRPGGRLVYFLPVIMSSFKEEDVPGHPMFHFISASVQGICGDLARVLVTMEKKLSDQQTSAEDFSWKEQCQNLEGNIREECFKAREARNEVRKQEQFASRSTQYKEVKSKE